MNSHSYCKLPGQLSATSFVLDGEGVILRPDGVSDFDRLHSRRPTARCSS